jgi:2-polyprenyl-6-hydroxyphenyl methylase / 3-demethylubiquinone-9 3-methyltransferase
MAKASIAPHTTKLASSIIADEAAHFGRLAADWWDPKGSSFMLHKLNPARLGYIRAQINRHFGTNPSSRTPLSGLRAMDVGCGAGLIAEPLARMGGSVVGVDAAPENIAVAQNHATQQNLAIDYTCGDITALNLGQFDVVTCLEVIEHVADPAAFVAALAQHLAPDGLMIVSTPNRTPQSQLLLVGAAELVGAIPRGTHDWNMFITPDEMKEHLVAARLVVHDTKGLAFSPARGFEISSNMALNYLMAAAFA